MSRTRLALLSASTLLFALPVSAQPAPAGASSPPPAIPASAPAPGTPDSAAPGAPETCELAVTTSDDAGSIIIDGETRGEGSFEGRFAVGHHTLRVERVGFEPFEKSLNCFAGDVYAESVLLEPRVSLSPAVPDLKARGSESDGIYGGVQLLGAFAPAGSGTTLEDACDTTGATTCKPGTVAGAGLSGYVGWMIDPLGLELALFGAGDVVSPVANFDGVNGSDINPLVAAPERREKFTIARFGGGAALRARIFKDISRFRFAFALGPGLAYRYLVMKRDTEAAGGLTGEVADSGAGYLSALLSIELSGQVMLGKTTALSVGVSSWFEHAGNDVQSEPENRAVLAAGDQVVPQYTPAYDMASGTQWFLGPFVGLAFGP